MAIKLQKYNRQVGATPNPQTQISKAIDMGEAVLVGGAKLGLSLGSAVSDFRKRAQKHKDEGDLAGYKNDVRNWEKNLELEKTQARLNDGITDDQLMDKVVIPSMEKFIASFQDSGYSPDILSLIDRDFGAEVKKVEINTQAEIVQNAIIESNQKKSEYAKSLESDGESELANKVWDNLKSTSKPGQVEKWRSESAVGRELLIIRQAEIDVSEGRSNEKEYRSILEESNKRVQSNEYVMESDKYRHKIETMGKIGSVSRKKAVETARAWGELRTLDRKGDLGGAELEKFERVVGQNNVDILRQKNFESLSKGAVEDDDMRKAVIAINDFKDGRIETLTEAINKTKKIKGKAGKRAFWEITEIYKDRIDANVEESTPLKTFRNDYFENVSRFILLDKEGGGFSGVTRKEGWYDRRMDAFDKWIKKNPDASQEDYFTFRYEQLKEDAAFFVGGLTAPQQPSRKIVGEKLDANGKRIAVQYDDGSVEEL